MSAWNFDISAAPRDGTHVILALQNKTTIRSYWCKPLHDPEHWCMLSHKNEPVAWMLWPEHPYFSSGGHKASCPSLAAREADESAVSNSKAETSRQTSPVVETETAKRGADVSKVICPALIDDVGGQ